MSIIYDALQKTQRNREVKIENPALERRFGVWIDRGLSALIAVLVVMLLFAYVPRWFKHSAAVASTTQTASATTSTAEVTGDLVLNGVFVADEEKVALINNKTLHLGDAVEGMKIVAIDENSVILQNGSHRLVLQVPG